MELRMRWDANGDPQDLPEDDKTLFTGYMSECVSVVVLFNLTGGTYSNIRGYHAGGGIQNTNWAALFNGVPNQGSTLIYVIAGPGNFTELGQTWLRDGLAEGIAAQKMENATVAIYERRHAYIDRFGQIT